MKVRSVPIWTHCFRQLLQFLDDGLGNVDIRCSDALVNIIMQIREPEASNPSPNMVKKAHRKRNPRSSCHKAKNRTSAPSPSRLHRLLYKL